MAEALPITLIPEESIVSTVRLDVVNIGRLDVASLFQTLHTKRMRFEVPLACLVPSCTVSTTTCGACVLRMKGTMLITVLSAVRNKLCTAGMSAWCLRSAGHWHCLLPYHCDRGGSDPNLYFERILNTSPHILSWERAKWRVDFKIFLRNFISPTAAPVFRSVRKRIQCYSPHRADEAPR